MQGAFTTDDNTMQDSVALKKNVSDICDLKYHLTCVKLRFTPHGCYIFGNNKSVLFNTSIPDSTLKRTLAAWPTTLCEKDPQGMNGVRHT